MPLGREVLTTVMRKHQRYFPVLDAAGHLLPHFVTVANGFINTAQVPLPPAVMRYSMRPRSAHLYEVDDGS